MRATAAIGPLDPDGLPAASGSIGLLSVGISNARQEFDELCQRLEVDHDRSPAVRLANGAQDHMDLGAWATGRGANGDPWSHLTERLAQAGLTEQQVQAAWLKAAPSVPATMGEFPEHAEQTKRDLQEVVTRLGSRFPNLRLVYLSSRIYGGYAVTQLSPEPYAYEGAFAVRWLIQEQMQGDPPRRGANRAGADGVPVLLWGPYVWADGDRLRRPGALTWEREDFHADGTHPSPAGRQKVAEILHRFFKTDPTARPWFATPPGGRPT